MSDELLSQEEIDALYEAASAEAEGFDIEAFSEVLHVLVSSAVEALGRQVGLELTVEDGEAGLRRLDAWPEGEADFNAYAAFGFRVSGGVSGELAFVTSGSTALRLLGETAGGEEGVEFTEEHSAQLSAAGAKMAQALTDALAVILPAPVHVDVSLQSGSLEAGRPRFVSGASALVADFSVRSAGGESWPAWVVAQHDLASAVIHQLSQAESEPARAEQAGALDAPSAFQPEETRGDRRGEAVRGPRPAMTGRIIRGAEGVEPAVFGALTRPVAVEEPRSIDLILDVPLQVSVELGRAQLQIREILDLAPGSVVELDKLAGEAVDVYVNGKLIAKGEVVVMDENFGVKITDIVSRQERVSNLG